MSFPGSVEAAAPFAGAAHPPKSAKTVGSADDFADLMRGAETSSPDAAMSDAEHDGPVAVDGPIAIDGDTAVAKVADATSDAPVAADDANLQATFRTANLSGFFRSLRTLDASAEPAKPTAEPADAGATVVAQSSDIDAVATPIVIADVAAPLRDVTAPVCLTPVDTSATEVSTTDSPEVAAPVAMSIASAPTPAPVPAVPEVAVQSSAIPADSQTAGTVDTFVAAAWHDALSANRPGQIDSRESTAQVPLIETASVRVPGEPYVLAAMSPNAQAAAAALRQMTAQQPTVESATVPVLSAVAAIAGQTPIAVTAESVQASAVVDAAVLSSNSHVSLAAAVLAAQVPQSSAASAAPATGTSAGAVKMTLGGPAAAAVPPVRVDRPAMAAHVLASVFTPHLVSATPSPVTGATTISQPALTEAVESQMADQIVQSLRMQFEQGGGEAKIELNPQYLGRVQVNVRVEQGAVSASVQAETPLVREWIAANREELTHTLSQQGLKLEKLDVAEAPKEQQARDNGRDSRQPQREPARPRRDERPSGVDTFEIQDSQEIA